jgi:hypothetical protein
MVASSTYYTCTRTALTASAGAANLVTDFRSSWLLSAGKDVSRFRPSLSVWATSQSPVSTHCGRKSACDLLRTQRVAPRCLGTPISASDDKRTPFRYATKDGLQLR